MPAKIEINEAYFRARSTVDPETGCWNWTLFRSPTGYGKTSGGISQYGEQQAHRLAYRVLRNEGKPLIGEIDHLCRNRACVNPEHLDDVEHRENMMRAPYNSHIMSRAGKTECVRGHPMDGVSFGANGVQRYCKTCKRAATARHRARHADTG